MKKNKIKKIIVPTIYVLIVISSFISVSIINNMLLGGINNYDYSKSLMKEVTQAVLKENGVGEFIKPTVSSNVSKKIGFYKKDDSETIQQESLIIYKNTYMPSTGIMYESPESFDVISVFDGVIEEINTDSIMGKYIVVKHNDNLRTYYYSLTDVVLNVGDSISQGTILGKGTSNELNAKYSLYFEVYYNNEAIDPENFYVTNPTEMQ